MADKPDNGGGRLARAISAGLDLDEFAATDVDAPMSDVTPPPETRGGRTYPKRRTTRPGEVVELTGGTSVGEYQVEEQIGEGGMGTVYSAVHPLIGKKVAIKVLKAELCANQGSIDRFVQEAQAVNKIGHPNIVDVFSLGELPDGRAYFVMEWLRGEDLKTRIARGPLPLEEACTILDGIARALEAAHAKEIVHRDLKPDNVFLHEVESGSRMVKLLDFGIAKLSKTSPGVEKTQTGNMLGTPRYIAPEQARGIQVDHRSDIYSLGVMAYETLAGQPPFDGETAMDLVVKHLSEPPPPLSTHVKVPDPLEQCIMAMIAKDPAERPTLAQVRAVLTDPARRLTPVPVSAVTAPAPVVATPRANRWVLPLVVVVLGMIGVVAWKVTREEPAPPPATPEVSTAPATAPVTPPVTPPPTPVTPPTPVVTTRGTLEVDVQGATDAAIAVDGKERGRGVSIKLELEAGTHEVVVQAPGRPAITRIVNVNADGTSTVTIVVPAKPVSGPRPPRPPTPPPPEGGDDDLLAPKHK